MTLEVCAGVGPHLSLEPLLFLVGAPATLVTWRHLSSQRSPHKAFQRQQYRESTPPPAKMQPALKRKTMAGPRATPLMLSRHLPLKGGRGAAACPPATSTGGCLCFLHHWVSGLWLQAAPLLLHPAGSTWGPGTRGEKDPLKLHLGLGLQTQSSEMWAYVTYLFIFKQAPSKLRTLKTPFKRKFGTQQYH